MDCRRRWQRWALVGVRLLLLLSFLFGPVLSAQALPARPAEEPAVTAPLLAGPSRPPTPEERANVISALGQMELYFIENQGQTDESVAYYLKGDDTTVCFSDKGLTFVIDGVDLGNHDFGLPTAEIGRYTFRLEFVGARAVAPVGDEEAETAVSYFKGSPEDWHTGLATYRRLVYRDLWPGIDLVYYGSGGNLKYEFLVHPGADPDQIRLRYQGIDELRLAEAGALELITPVRVLTDEAPLAYQEVGGERREAEVGYALSGHSYRFEIGDYDPALPLVIDPELIYCGYIGGSGGEYGYDYGIAVDASGAAYVTGCTESGEATFPVLVGPDLTFNGSYDAFVAKVAPDGTHLVYCGYIGGSGYEYGYGIAVDASGAAYVTGETYSSEAEGFPALVGPDLTLNGSYDAFVAKVAPDGTHLVYCGYIGGSGYEYGYGIAVDASGAAYVTGCTESGEATFPVLVGPDLTHNGGSDAFVAKVTPDGTHLAYCGYIGGSGYEYGYGCGGGIAVDVGGAAYVTGTTSSSEAEGFPVLVGPDLTYNADDDPYTALEDAFVAKVAPDGTHLVYCGYIGSLGQDYGQGIAVDTDGAAYLVGTSYPDPGRTSGTFPVLVGPDLTYNGSLDAFVAKVAPDGTHLAYCGYIGGSGYEYGYGIAVDASGAAYVTGITSSSEATFPVLVGPGLTFNGNWDAFVAKVAPDGTHLAYCGYIGGSGSDQGRGGIAVDASGATYVSGHTESSEATFPVLVGPDLTFNGDWDAFVAKVGPEGYTPGQPGEITLLDNLTLRTEAGYWPPNIGDKIIAHIHVRNSGDQALHVEHIGVRGRRNATDSWDIGFWTIDLGAGQEWEFNPNNERPLEAGSYSFRVSYSLDGTTWTEIGNEVNFTAASPIATPTTEPTTPASTGVVSGVITDGFAYPLKDIAVELSNVDSGFSSTTSTSSTGAYAFSSVPGGLGYQLEVRLAAIDGTRRVLTGAEDELVLQSAPFALDERGFTANVLLSDGLSSLWSTGNASRSALHDYAVIYRHTTQVQDFVRDALQYAQYTSPLSLYTFASTEFTHYNGASQAIYINGHDSPSSGANRPMNREWHESFHHLMNVRFGGFPPFAGNEYNHKGYDNDSSDDSWAEGWAEFWACALAQFVGHPTPWLYAMEGGTISVEQNYSARHRNGSQSLEELAVASLLWDFLDARNPIDGDNVDLSLIDLWGVIGDESHNDMTDVKDVYDSFIISLSSLRNEDDGAQVRVWDVQQLFTNHGFYSEFNSNSLCDTPEEESSVGYSGEPSRPYRRNTPVIPGAAILLNILDLQGSPATTARIRVSVRFPEPYYNYSYEVEAPADRLLRLMPPPEADPATVTVVALTDTEFSSQAYTTDSATFWRAVEGADTEYVSEETLVLDTVGAYDARVFLPLLLDYR